MLILDILPHVSKISLFFTIHRNFCPISDEFPFALDIGSARHIFLFPACAMVTDQVQITKMSWHAGTSIIPSSANLP